MAVLIYGDYKVEVDEQQVLKDLGLPDKMGPDSYRAWSAAHPLGWTAFQGWLDSTTIRNSDGFILKMQDVACLPIILSYQDLEDQNSVGYKINKCLANLDLPGFTRYSLFLQSDRLGKEYFVGFHELKDPRKVQGPYAHVLGAPEQIALGPSPEVGGIYYPHDDPKHEWVVITLAKDEQTLEPTVVYEDGVRVKTSTVKHWCTPVFREGMYVPRYERLC